MKFRRTTTSTADSPPISIEDLAALLDGRWAAGWNPLDMEREARVDRLARRLFVDALAWNSRTWHPLAAPLWADQADELGAVVWWSETSDFSEQFAVRNQASSDECESALSLLNVLWSMPHEQPLFENPPTEPGRFERSSSVDDWVLTKVRALLAKAEASEYANEAEAFSAKAQELIAKHAIDIALLADEHDVPGGRRIYIDNPYAKPKFMLLAGIAAANQCRAVWSQGRTTATLVGHQSDLLVVEMLFTSLLVQGTGAILSSGPQKTASGRSTTKSWRNAFWHGFAGRIQERLKAATEEVRATRDAESGGSILPVLAERSDKVELALATAFPTLGTMRASVSNVEGMDAGRRFANVADVASSNRVAKSKRRQLGS